MAIIDSHQHVWDLSKAHYDWLGPDQAQINRSFDFDELRPSLRAAGIEATVLVQAADNAEDTDAMLEVAASTPEIVGLVAYVPLERPQEAHDRLLELRRNPLVVGVRNLIHDRADPDWILRPEVDEGLGVLEAAGVPFDYVAVLPRHLEHVSVLADRHPDLRIVIDHLAKPPIGLASHEPWATLTARAAENPNVYAKVSGLYSATDDPASWTTEELRPFVDHALDVFGPSRLMYGGDWPVSLLAGGYERIWRAANEIFSEWSPTEREAVLGRTAERFYAIDSRLLERAAAASVVHRRSPIPAPSLTTRTDSE